MDQKQFEATLADAEARLRRLRVLYDQWFAGIERIEPRTPRQDLERMIARLRGQQIRNTALRFRFSQFLQRYTTYNTYWKRVSRQIEEGTYKRDVLRAQRMRKAAATDEAPRGHDPYELDVDIDIESALDAVMGEEMGDATAGQAAPSDSNGAAKEAQSSPAGGITPFALPNEARPDNAPVRRFPAPPGPSNGKTGGHRSLPPPVPAAVKMSQRPAKSGGISDDQIRSLYNRYVEARRNNSERTDNVRIESLAKSVRDMMPKLHKKHGGKQIDFEVVVRNGRVALKPIAK